jgi:hypothetical protein
MQSSLAGGEGVAMSVAVLDSELIVPGSAAEWAISLSQDFQFY